MLGKGPRTRGGKKDGTRGDELVRRALMTKAGKNKGYFRFTATYLPKHNVRRKFIMPNEDTEPEIDIMNQSKSTGLQVIYSAKEVTPKMLNFSNTKRKRDFLSEALRLYMGALPISEKKYKETELCIKGAIPQYLHAEYSQLPHDVSIKDCLPDTDKEDDDEND